MGLFTGIGYLFFLRGKLVNDVYTYLENIGYKDQGDIYKNQGKIPMTYVGNNKFILNDYDSNTNKYKPLFITNTYSSTIHSPSTLGGRRRHKRKKSKRNKSKKSKKIKTRRR